MPRRKDIDAIFIIGAGPIIIGQATEFDYSGTQACKALKAEGYRIALVNSNPATIMTDPSMADATYIEPITPAVVADILEREKKLHPNEKMVLLPTMGGQTALNTAMALHKNGVLKKLGIEMIGAKPEAIDKAEDREQFKTAMANIGLNTPTARLVRNRADAEVALTKIGLPLIIRPSFTLGGRGGGIAHNEQDYFDKVNYGLQESNLATDGKGSILVEQSVLGWKEFEMEVVRDKNDNAIIICSIENLDPMGVHTGDSITIAPALTLTDKEYQEMRMASLAVLREIGVETGGSNVQFAINPKNGEMVVIEMNPRVSRSSALASKATGFPIAKVAALLAVGYTLDELPNDITGGKIPASFEPSLDYVVTKIPRFAFEKFKGADDTLTTTMKSVGEVMAIGRNFKESLGKAIAALEIYNPLQMDYIIYAMDVEKITDEDLSRPHPLRLLKIFRAINDGRTIENIYELTKIDKWFLIQMAQMIEIRKEIKQVASFTLMPEMMNEELIQPENFNEEAIKKILAKAKGQGFSDSVLGQITRNYFYESATTGYPLTETLKDSKIRQKLKDLGIVPIFKRIDSCAGEFPSPTPYLYSSYEGHFVDGKYQPGEDEADVSDRKKIVILGGGANRIGQGIEFDYACVHAALSLKKHGYETIMINCNPETVSTDYDTADRLYFEPLTAEHVLNILDKEATRGEVVGVIVQYGGQTPLKLAQDIVNAGYKILGTSLDSINHTEDRKLFSKTIDDLKLRQPANFTATNPNKALEFAKQIGFPVMLRPSFVLGGRAMEIAYDEEACRKIIKDIMIVASDGDIISEFLQPPVLIDKYLSDAIEVDVDAIADGEEVLVAGVMEHIEEAGVHSGDSACALPTFSLSEKTLQQIERQTIALGRELKVKGLMNIQFAVTKNQAGDYADIFILEMNPRASRTAPFVAKATGYPLAEMGARVMAGEKLTNLPRPASVAQMQKLPFVSVKEAVFPFDRFINFSDSTNIESNIRGAEVALGPEMRSTGEVMGIAGDIATAFAKSQLAAGAGIPTADHANAKVFISVKDADKPAVLPLAKQLQAHGFTILATGGTADYFTKHGLKNITSVKKISQEKNSDANIKQLLLTNQIAMVFNTMAGRTSRGDAKTIRALAVKNHIPYFTTTRAMAQVANAVVNASTPATAQKKSTTDGVKSIQEYHKLVK
ncbi:MAG: carbamoyl-phosphate synthase large subunit [Hydrotalea sp.]|nr:carbamoyl-phosphate synthase large subunit [Hydrotalea sp.]